MSNPAFVVGATPSVVADFKVDEYMDAAALPAAVSYPLVVNEETGAESQCPIPYHSFPQWPTREHARRVVTQVAALAGNAKSVTLSMKTSAMAGPESAGFFVRVVGDRGEVSLPAGPFAFQLWRNAGPAIAWVIEQLKSIGAY